MRCRSQEGDTKNMELLKICYYLGIQIADNLLHLLTVVRYFDTLQVYARALLPRLG